MVAHAGETNFIATTRQLPISPSFLRQITSPLYRLRSFLSRVPVRIDIFKDVTGAPGAIEGVGEDQYWRGVRQLRALLIETEKVSTCKTHREREITRALCQSVYFCVCAVEKSIIKATRLESRTAKINNKRRFLSTLCVALYFLSAPLKKEKYWPKFLWGVCAL